MAKGNFIEYVVSDNPNKYPNDGEQGGYYYELVEDVTPEVTAQTPIITQIAENLGVSITTPSGTNKHILQGNNANLQLISGYEPISPTGIAITTPPTKVEYAKGDTLDLSGIVVTGTFDNGVVVDITDDCTFSPANGATLTGNETSVTVSFTWGGKTYTTTQAITVVLVKIVTWAGGTDEEIVKMVEAADQGLINLSDYWAVGDIRTVQLSAMSATGVGESHAAQQVDLVLMHAGGYDLNAAVASGRTKCSFVVGLKDSLAEAGYMNSSITNRYSWDGSARRTWCNNVFRNAIPSTLKAIFKQFKTVTAQASAGSLNLTSVDYFTLPAEIEVFGSRSYSIISEEGPLFQFDYYKTGSNRIKKEGKTGNSSHWWLRSPCWKDSDSFCFVVNSGTPNYSYANHTFGLSPFGCI